MNIHTLSRNIFECPIKVNKTEILSENKINQQLLYNCKVYLLMK